MEDQGLCETCGRWKLTKEDRRQLARENHANTELVRALDEYRLAPRPSEFLPAPDNDKAKNELVAAVVRWAELHCIWCGENHPHDGVNHNVHGAKMACTWR